ncbi:MAG: hypothetical protein Q9217_004580 [Psora testacea]
MEGAATQLRAILERSKRIKPAVASPDTFHFPLILISAKMPGTNASGSSDDNIPVSLRAQENFGAEGWGPGPTPDFEMPPILSKSPPRGSSKSPIPLSSGESSSDESVSDQPLSRTSLFRGDKRPPASNGSVPTISGQNENRQALGPSNRPSGRLQNYDLIKAPHMTTSPPDEPFGTFSKLGADVIATGAGVGGRLPHSTIRMMVDDFAAKVNKRFVDRGYYYTDSETNQDLPSLEEVLFRTNEMQEPPQTGGSVVHLTGGSDESLGHAVENGWNECDSPKSGWGESRGEPIRCNDARSEICDSQDAERQGDDTQNTTREHADIQDAEREAGSGSSIHTGDVSPLEEQGRKQGGERSSLSTPPTSVAGSEAGTSTLPLRNEFSTAHSTSPHRHPCLPSTACTQFHESIDKGRYDNENDPSTSVDKRAQWDGEAADADDAGGGHPGDHNEKIALLRPMRKRRRSAAVKKHPAKRHVKRCLFSSPHSSEEESETADGSDFSSYAPTEPYPTRSPRQTSNHSGGPRGDTSDNSGMEIGGHSKSPPVSPMAVIYE